MPADPYQQARRARIPTPPSSNSSTNASTALTGLVLGDPIVQLLRKQHRLRSWRSPSMNRLMGGSLLRDPSTLTTNGSSSFHTASAKSSRSLRRSIPRGKRRMIGFRLFDEVFGD